MALRLFGGDGNSCSAFGAGVGGEFVEEVFAFGAAGFFEVDVETQVAFLAMAAAHGDGLSGFAAGAFDFETLEDGAGFDEAFDFLEVDKDGENDRGSAGEDRERPGKAPIEIILVEIEYFENSVRDKPGAADYADGGNPTGLRGASANLFR